MDIENGARININGTFLGIGIAMTKTRQSWYVTERLILIWIRTMYLYEADKWIT